MYGFDTTQDLTPHAADLAKKGVAFAARYLSRNPNKNLSPGEAKALSAVGIRCVVVWEAQGDRYSSFSATQGAMGWAGSRSYASWQIKQYDEHALPGWAKAWALDFAIDADEVRGDDYGGFLLDVPKTAPKTTPVPKVTVPVPIARPVLRQGMTGDDVIEMQGYLGIDQDGIFGRNTTAAVKAFQRSHGLVVDGRVGSSTWNSLMAANA